MSRAETFRFVARCLQPAIRQTPPPPEAPVPWEEVIAAASRQMATPALGWCLRGETGVPEPVRDYFDAAFQLNRLRNAEILKGLEQALHSLADARIPALLLKGSAMLAAGVYPEIGMRVLGDIDMLVPESSLARASELLAEAGFCPEPRRREWVDVAHHHLPMQVHAQSGVGIELHKTALERPIAALLPSEALFERALPVRLGGAPALIPAAEDRIFHTIVHGQISDRSYRMGIPHLRYLLDVAMITARSGGEIDWSALRERFRAAGHLPVLLDVLALSEFLLGEPAPPPLRREGDAARSAARLEKALGRSERYRRTAAWGWLLRDLPTIVREDPRRLVRALHPANWRSHLARRSPVW